MSSDLVSSVEGSTTAAHPASRTQPMRWKEFTALLLSTACADLLIFRTIGFVGPALFFALVPFFFCARDNQSREKWTACIVIGMLWLCAVRLVWSGSVLTFNVTFPVAPSWSSSLTSHSSPT